MPKISDFVDLHFRHFNAASLRDAAVGWNTLLEDEGGGMFVTLAGAMSTAELGISLARMIRLGKIHGICCTGANLEEDVFNIVAHDHYVRIPHYRELTAYMEQQLLDKHLNRVTDTCIPEHEAMRKIESKVLELWAKADASGQRKFPHEFLYELLLSGRLDDEFQIPREHSWLLAAAEINLPLFVPGWEDSTLGNMFAAATIRGDLKSTTTIKGGIDYMVELADYYMNFGKPLGFFQIGGGISGDFPICVVPMLEQDLEKKDVPLWAYFCQISDSTTSYGSYSGAVPNEKITWGKLGPETPKYIIESDATIVAPLIFSYVLGE